MAKSSEIIVAIVGSGPSGFYAAESLIKSEYDIRVNIIEKLPVPFGLVRYGVAPDHPKLKQVIAVYNKIAEHPNVNFFGNVEVGKDITLEDLQKTHHAVILCYGSSSSRRLNISGTDISGYHTTRDFVAWYNGLPEAKDYNFDLSQESAVIIGQGNVAADVCRILVKSPDELHLTDIDKNAQEQLAESKVRNIHIIGRRGPVQAKFSSKELKELKELKNCSNIIEQEGFVIDENDQYELDDKSSTNNAKCVEYFKSFDHRKKAETEYTIQYHFLLDPVQIHGKSQIDYMSFMRNRLIGEAFHRLAEPTGDIVKINCGLCFSSIGYCGVPIDGVPFNKKRMTILNKQGRVIDNNEKVVKGLYTSGWIKRGPSGIIGTNRLDSIETTASLIEDINVLKECNQISSDNFSQLLTRKGCYYIDYDKWKMIDAKEIEYGKKLGKPRLKITDIQHMLEITK